MPAVTQPQQLPNFNSLWNYNDPAATGIKFRALIPMAEAANDPSYLAQLLTQVARTESLQGHFTECHAILDRVQSMLSADLKLAHVRYLLERGRAYNSAKQQATAIPLFTEAFAIADSIGQPEYAVDALHMVANAQTDPPQCLEWNRKAVAYS